MFKNWTYCAALATVLSMTLLSGLVHGYLDSRWVVGPDLQKIGEKLPGLPEQVGPWVRVSDQPLEPAAQRLLRCYGSLVREYWNPTTGDRVSVAVLFGPRGPIAVHTPEVCYSSAGTQLIGERVVREVQSGGQTDELWRVQFGTPDDPKPTLDVWYAWSDGRAWQASEHPRFWLTDRLYKIQLAGRPAQNGERSSCDDFLTHFLPVVREVIGPS